MLSGVLSRLRAWLAVEDPEDRIEGTGETIASPQHRRNREARRELESGDRYPDHDRE
ncbi:MULTISPECIES: hypothetical protein [Saliphagus]|uniref:Uncharacterized protein n=1 Tax=Saliphagus infecundisoli TaxID=1849069 RepID=A0ABD5QCS0_9EURY|nr:MULTISPECIES: hypothetical protein [Saliphagus]